MKRVIDIPIEAFELLQNKNDLSISECILANSEPLTDYVIDIHEIPKDYTYDAETENFYVYRNFYTGDVIHIIKEPITYRLIGHWVFEDGNIPYCSNCKKYSDDADMQDIRGEVKFCFHCGSLMEDTDVEN